MDDRSGDQSEMVAFRAAIDAKYAMHVQAFEDGDPEPILDRFFTEDGATATGRSTPASASRCRPTLPPEVDCARWKLQRFCGDGRSSTWQDVAGDPAGPA
jgi:hypothetical protein